MQTTAPAFDVWKHRASTFTVINAPKKKVFKTVYTRQPRPNFLPHIPHMDIAFDDGIVQEFSFEVTGEDNCKRCVRTISRCSEDTIEFFQPEPPPYLSGYYVRWKFTELPNKQCQITSDNFWSLKNEQTDESGNEPTISAAEQTKLRILTYANKALDDLKKQIEGGEVL